MKRFPYNFDPENALPIPGERLLKQVFNAHFHYGDEPRLEIYFRREAMDELRTFMDDATRKNWECCYWCLISRLHCQDEMGFRKHLNYWWDWDRESYRTVRVADVTKFIPGEHYHTLNEKFNTLGEAKRHLMHEGYEFGTFKEIHVYQREGD